LVRGEGDVCVKISVSNVSKMIACMGQATAYLHAAPYILKELCSIKSILGQGKGEGADYQSAEQ